MKKEPSKKRELVFLFQFFFFALLPAKAKQSKSSKSTCDPQFSKKKKRKSWEREGGGRKRVNLILYYLSHMSPREHQVPHRKTKKLGGTVYTGYF